MRSEGRRPRFVAQLRGALRRSDDVGEQHGRQHAVRRCSPASAGEKRFDLVEHAVGVAGEPDVVIAFKLHQSRVRDALGEILRVARHARGGHHAGATAGRRLDALERGTHVAVQVQVEHRPEIPGATGQALTARPPAPLRDVTHPARRQLVDDPTIADGPLEAVEIFRECRIRASRRADRGHVRSARTSSKSTSERTRCGWLAVSNMTGSADSDIAKTDTHSLPTASSTATSPSVQACIAGTVVDRHRIGAPDAEEIGQDQAAERRQPAKMAGDGGLIPQQVDREGRGRHEEQIGPAPPTTW